MFVRKVFPKGRPSIACKNRFISNQIISTNGLFLLGHGQLRVNKVYYMETHHNKSENQEQLTQFLILKNIASIKMRCIKKAWKLAWYLKHCNNFFFTFAVSRLMGGSASGSMGHMSNSMSLAACSVTDSKPMQFPLAQRRKRRVLFTQAQVSCSHAHTYNSFILTFILLVIFSIEKYFRLK